jgi:hypothetical protein
MATISKGCNQDFKRMYMERLLTSVNVEAPVIKQNIYSRSPKTGEKH